MSTISVQPVDRTEQLTPLVQTVVNGELVRLGMALRPVWCSIRSGQPCTIVSVSTMVQAMCAS